MPALSRCSAGLLPKPPTWKVLPLNVNVPNPLMLSVNVSLASVVLNVPTWKLAAELLITKAPGPLITSELLWLLAVLPKTKVAVLVNVVAALGIERLCWTVLENVNAPIVKDWSTVLVVPLAEPPVAVKTMAFPLGEPFAFQLPLFDQLISVPPGVHVKVAAEAMLRQ